MSDDYIIEKAEKGPEEESRERVYYRSVHFGQGGLNWKSKLKIAAFIVGGIAVGTIFFLFFLTLFIYLIVPVAVLLALWSIINRRR